MPSTGDNANGSRQLCALLGHELRNPLAAAITKVSLASAQMDAMDPRGEHLKDALRELSRLSTLLSAYLEYGRGAPIHQRDIDLVQVLQAVTSRSHSTRVESEVGEVRVQGDPDLLGRAFENLLENAFQAGAGEVCIRVRNSEGAAVVDIVDDGPGVPEELREVVFEPFVSGRGSSGLGLAVARDVIERQGGSISLLPVPRRNARGATFEVILPIEESAPVGTDGAI